MRLVDGINTQLAWEETELSWARDAAGNDLLLLLGNEPDHAWLAFSEQVVDLAARPRHPPRARASAPTRRRRPTRARRSLAASASERRPRRRACCAPRVEVPSGVQGMIERRAALARPPGPRPVGPGAPLRGRHALPRRPASPCSRRPTGSAGLELPTGRPRRAGRGQPPPPRRADLPEPRAPGDGRPARGPGRRGRPPSAALSATSRRRARRRARAVPPRAALTRPALDRAVKSRTRVARMRIDGGHRRGPARRRRPRRKVLEEQGYDGLWTAETAHDPFFPLAARLAGDRAGRAGHRHRRGVRPQPDEPGPDRLGPAGGVAAAGSSSASAARSSRTSPSASRCRGRTRPPACGR